jgi:hypothetical protein
MKISIRATAAQAHPDFWERLRVFHRWRDSDHVPTSVGSRLFVNRHKLAVVAEPSGQFACARFCEGTLVLPPGKAH